MESPEDIMIGVRMTIPVMRPQLPVASVVRPYLERMDASGIYSNFGPLVTELEQRYAGFLGVDPRQVVAVTNATLGIQGALTVIGSKRWLVPAYTFAATAHAVGQAGFEITFVDVSEETWALELSSTSVEDDTGVLSVAPFGAPVDLLSWRGHKHIVIDAAASLGASESRLANLPHGWAVCFSLHATKVLPAGEGGLVVFGDIDEANRFRRWENFGFDQARSSQFVATNAKMSEIHAAYGLASLENWEQEKAEWKAALDQAASISANFGIDCLVQEMSGVRPYWIVRFETKSNLIRASQALDLAGVQTRSWWPQLLPDMPAFSHRGVGRYPVAEELCETTLALPMFRGMSANDFDTVIGALETCTHRVP